MFNAEEVGAAIVILIAIGLLFLSNQSIYI